MSWVLAGHAYGRFNVGSGIMVNNALSVIDPKGSFYGNAAFGAIINAFVR